MSDSPQEEPSMEEILASIRRIISEDTNPAARAEATDADDDVLELTDFAEDEPIAAADGPAEQEMMPSSMFREADLPQTKPAKREASPPPSELADLVSLDEDVTPVYAPAIMEQRPLDREAIVSSETESVSSAAFASIANQVRAKLHRDLPVGNSAATLESMVRELLRPMLQEWLDEHLPSVVESAVYAEVQRLSRAAG